MEKSTLPVRAAETLETILHSGNNSVQFEILSNPEFMAEGTGNQRDMEDPDRILIGSMDTPSGIAARDILMDIISSLGSKGTFDHHGIYGVANSQNWQPTLSSLSESLPSTALLLCAR